MAEFVHDRPRHVVVAAVAVSAYFLVMHIGIVDPGDHQDTPLNVWVRSTRRLLDDHCRGVYVFEGIDTNFHVCEGEATSSNLCVNDDRLAVGIPVHAVYRAATPLAEEHVGPGRGDRLVPCDDGVGNGRWNDDSWIG